VQYGTTERLIRGRCHSEPSKDGMFPIAQTLVAWRVG